MRWPKYCCCWRVSPRRRGRWISISVDRPTCSTSVSSGTLVAPHSAISLTCGHSMLEGAPTEALTLGIAPACTEYYQGRPNWLDHVLVRRSMIEVDQAANVRVTGYCALTRCASIGTEKPAAYRELSDHCPFVFEIANRDAD
jgi:hypothetical protein